MRAARHQAGLLQRRRGRPCPAAKRSSRSPRLTAKISLRKRVLEPALREAALHRHLTALEAEARAVVAGAGLLALDALARLLAGARAGAAAEALAVAGRARSVPSACAAWFPCVDPYSTPLSRPGPGARPCESCHGRETLSGNDHGDAHLVQAEAPDGPLVLLRAVDAAPDQRDLQLRAPWSSYSLELFERLAARARPRLRRCAAAGARRRSRG